jgi:hypothetical protein
MIYIYSHVSFPPEDDFPSDEKRYEWQMAIRANYLLLGDRNHKLTVDWAVAPRQIIATNLTWINRGELIAGSFMCAVTGASVPATDVDIYFKCKQDAIDFCKVNPHLAANTSLSDIAINVVDGSTALNLIYGVHYDSPEDLISGFDIRAASIALDPNTNKVYAVRGSFGDCHGSRIIYNPIPHNTTIARLVKYVQKGFGIDPYQRLFLSEFLKSDQYNTELELTTGYRAVQK